MAATSQNPQVVGSSAKIHEYRGSNRLANVTGSERHVVYGGRIPWIDVYGAAVGTKPTDCAVVEEHTHEEGAQPIVRHEGAICGAHLWYVTECDPYGVCQPPRQYIAPLCTSHNSKTSTTFVLREGVQLMRVRQKMLQAEIRQLKRRLNDEHPTST